jgi:LacI family transcriptional regulator
MKKMLSIHDLAKQIGTSATAISFVINGKATAKGISQELQEKIQSYIKKVGYKPNLVAQSLRTGKSKIIGMLVEDVSDYFFSHIARGVEELAYQYNYKIFFASTKNDTAKTKSLLQLFRDRQVDGYIIAPPLGIETEVNTLLEDGFPVVLIDRYFKDVDTYNVLVDNFVGVYKAIEHLHNNGFSNIGFITLNSQQSQMKERLEGYLKAIQLSGQKNCILEVPYDNPADTSVKMVSTFLTKHKELDAVLFATNYLTNYGIEAINQLSLSIPGDLAVVSFDDTTHFRLLSPTITAIAQPLNDIAYHVITKLMACLNSEKVNNKKEMVVLPTKLIIRNSSKQVKKSKMIAV